jgi:outer membrane lipoprotein carrier protein
MKRIWTLLILSGALIASPISVPDNFKADFKQRITNPDKKVIHYRGTVRFSDEKMLKWVYREPTQKEVCSNGENVTVVDHDLEQVSYYLIEKGFDLAKILKSAKPYKKTKTVFIAKYEGKNYTIQLDGKQRLWRVAYYDDLDNEVLIIFENMRYGKGKLPIKSLLCEAPESYDVIGE